jgi:hypothetical protein
MGTWFDRLRGISQGRSTPENITPVDGNKVFVLGEDEPQEVAVLMDGDYTEVSQVVDLTDYDFVKATMDTVGRACGVSEAVPGWASDSAELFRFNFDIPGSVSRNLIIPAGEVAGFTLDSVGAVSSGKETYSGAQTYCRDIPSGNIAPAHLAGLHSPAVATPLSVLDQYTLQVWVNFFIEEHPESTGVDWVILRFYASDGINSWGIVFEV